MADTEIAPAPGADPSGDGTGGPRVARKRGISDRPLARLFVSPSIVLMAIVALFPVIWAVTMSLFLFTRFEIGEFGGAQNYTDVLTSGRWWDAVNFTFVFTVTSVTLEFVIGMGFALLMNQAFRGRGVTRAAILIPWVIPTVIAAQMWFFMFNVTPGVINSLLGLGDFNWLGQPGWPIVAIVFADVWKTAPFVALLLLAGLQTIPGDVYESARVDNAGMWQRFRHITLPLLKPAILVALLFRTVDALRVYDLPQVMTQGAFGTESLSILVQQSIVRIPDLGVGTATSTLTFILVLGIGIIFVRLLGRDLVLGTEEGR
jgi:ABC-type sugar transport system permease subunit